ncbi:TonB family protein [Hymenobacter sp. B81]|uniref:TonB family protein n=1 Tax=Hymenobacter sp. B81 TaxID=3344878 RepID=UPI0037DC0FFA
MRPADHRPAPEPAAPHLSAAVLRQYAAHALPPAERRRVEAHALDCPLCGDALDGYLSAPAPATDPAALAALQQRLHARVAAGREQPARARRGWWAAAAAVLVLLTAVAALRWWPTAPAPAPEPAPVATPARPAPTPSPAEPATPATAAPAPPPAPAETVAVAPPAAEPAAPPVAARPVRRPAPASSRPRRAPAASGGVVASAPAPASGAAAPAGPADQLLATRRPAALTDSGLPATLKPVPRPEAATRTKGVLPAPATISPLPAGGYPAFWAYVRRNQEYPGAARIDRAEGIVKLEFTVEADGAVSNLKVLKPVHPALEEEALRLVCEGPAWYPGVVNGKRTARTVELNIQFRLLDP